MATDQPDRAHELAQKHAPSFAHILAIAIRERERELVEEIAEWFEEWWVMGEMPSRDPKLVARKIREKWGKP